MEKHFNALKKSYGLKSARQIKERILWKHIMLLVKDAYDGPGTEKALEHFDRQWKLLEKIENRKKA